MINKADLALYNLGLMAGNKFKLLGTSIRLQQLLKLPIQ